MALVGNYIKFINTPSETETVVRDITYPASLKEDHPDYDKRGTTEQIEEPLLITTEEIIENVYVLIMGITIEKSISGDYNLSFAFRVFESEEARTEDIENFLIKSARTTHWDIDSTVTPLTHCYNHLKSLPECVNLVNA